MKRTIWGLGPSLLILLGLAGLLILAAIAAYLFNMGPVPTHPPQNGSIIQMEPGAGMHS